MTSTNVGYLFKELLRSLSGKGGASQLSPLLIAGGLVFLFLSLLAFSLLAGGELARGPGGEVLALLEPALPERQIDQLYLEIREWEEVAQIEFIFQEELAQGGHRRLIAAGLPPADLFRIVPRSREELEALKEKLAGLSSSGSSSGRGISRVLVLGQSPLQEALHTVFGGPMRALLLVILGGLALIAVRWALRRLIRGWHGELELLHLSGVSTRAMALPFVLLGLLLGGGSGALLGVVLYLLHLWGSGHMESFYRVLPALLDPAALVFLIFLGVVVGLAVGLLSGLWATRAIRRGLWR